jgi:phycoerythrobilin:ferredoxin oxidoreductase
MKQLLKRFSLLILVFLLNSKSMAEGFLSSAIPSRTFSKKKERFSHVKVVFSWNRQRHFYSRIDDHPKNSGGIYRPFAEYAWEKLMQSNLVEERNIDHLATNSSPSKDPKTSAEVKIHVQSAIGTPSQSSIRLGRYALLETMGKVSKDHDNYDRSIDNAIHVLNFVIFPNHEDYLLPLPVLGIDLVTLPGMKHLIAIDFQPIVSSSTEVSHTDGGNGIFPSWEKYKQFEVELERIHEEYVLQHRDILPWGGDIPPKASRFFSKYALWTRLQGEDAIDIIQTHVFEAFQAYFNLYLDMMTFAQCNDAIESNQDVSSVNDTMSKMDQRITIQNGTIDYLKYRRENDPARPMLTRLYGSEYTEELLSQVLFEMIEV